MRTCLKRISIYFSKSLGAAPSAAMVTTFALWAPNLSAALEDVKHESELSSIVTSGNLSTESYSAKERTSYALGVYLVSLNGSYLETKNAGVETANSWNLALRTERELSQSISVFLGYLIEADPYSGFIQRNATDIGGKYFFIKEKERNLFAELGFRYADTYNTIRDHLYEQFGRIYGEYSESVNDKLTARLWVEYLPNFTHPDAYMVNAEPSLTVTLNQHFAVRVSDLFKYHNYLTNPDTEKYLDTIFTTSLVARF